MSSLESIKNLYHPYKITIKGNTKIIDSTEGKFVLKKTNNDLFTLYSYLSSRGIDAYPKLIRNFNDKENLIEYEQSINLPKEQYEIEMAKTIADIHKKTSYYKNISIDDINSIKDNIESNINYLNDKYHKLIKSILLHDYLTPKDYLFVRNYYKIQESLDFCNSELNNWYLLNKEKDNIRISLLHNNLSLDHFIVGEDKNVFISWDNYRFDIPILDIVNLFKHSNIDYEIFLKTYLDNFSLEDYELKLLFILISIPDIIYDDNIRILKRNINRLYKIEKLIRPYYTKDEKE